MGLEEFLGLDDNNGMDPAAFERFKEKMQKAAAHIKAIKKEEKKRKKKESELVQVILKFISSSQKKDLVLLISRVLEQNIPANFILSIILLGNEEIQKEVGHYLALEGGSENDTKALVFFREDESMPLRVRIEIDKWVKDVIFQASEMPQKLIKTAYDISYNKDENGQKHEIKTISKSLVLLVAHIIFNYLKQNGIEGDIVKLKEFSEFLVKGIVAKTEEEIANRRELGGEVDNPF